ncbi:hypothetical protein D3C76_1756000 [compost metagenome]
MVCTVLMPKSWSFMILSNCCPLPVNTAPAPMPRSLFLNSLAVATWLPVNVFFTAAPSCGKSTRKKYQDSSVISFRW